MNPVRLSLGRVVVSANALDQLNRKDVQKALARHVVGDWGELCDADKRENDASLVHGLRLLSVYRDRADVKFWIITDADRSVTTILLPEDY